MTNKFIHKKPRKTVTYPEAGFYPSIDRFLIRSLQATVYMRCRGWRTPYPQKRQQTLGATLQALWKTAERRENSGFAEGLVREKDELNII
ncbi:hypothetical protein [Pseudomonas sp. B21-048]|uniref:hypothetical protein n=1 Tax=Pseudomonas sp. B21-048 TaxID=2895490 RepID=UPI00215E3E3C|nr:hypothetical protein [Pseudomonas sp. B21-048]UVK98392.1 hypothetical protein LOY56_24340 [Pseudomonas sp. B21-048]